jgi:hypothetical protein
LTLRSGCGRPHRGSRENDRKFAGCFRQIGHLRVEWPRTEASASHYVMVTAVGNATTLALGITTAHKAAAVASLNGQMRRDKIQLDDWTTCVSSKTPRGQAEIQRLSGEISAASEHEARTQAAPGSIDVWA